MKGFVLISILITVAIIALLVWGGMSWYGKSQINQIQQSQSEIDQAKKAAEQEKQYDQSLQNQMNSLDPQPVNYHGVLDNAKNLK